MSRPALGLSLLALLVALPVGAADDDPALAYRRAIEVEGRRLSGPGADWLRAEGAAADFFLFGEQHATTDIAAVATGLLLDLKPLGYRTTVIEVGPWSTPLLEDLLRDAGGAGFDRLVRDPATRLTFPFMFWAEEAAFLRVAIDGTPRGSLWGLDQEFIAGVKPLLALLGTRARTDAQRAAVTALESAARDNPMLLGTGDDAPWFALRDAFAASRDAEARRLIDDLLLSRRVYAPFTGRGGSGVTSNDTREHYMKDNLLRHLKPGEAGRWPKLFFKFGANHLGYGVASTHQLSLGNFVREYGYAHGKRTFNLMVDCLGGQGMNPQTGESVPCASYYLKPDSALRRLARPDGPTLFDLRALRQDRKVWKDWDEASRRLIESYDAWLALREVEPARYAGASP